MLGGEWGEFLYEYDSQNRRWKHLFDNLPGTNPFVFSTAEERIVLMTNGQLFELTSTGKLLKCVNAPAQLNRLLEGPDKTIFFVTNSGRLFRLEQLLPGGQNFRGKFHEIKYTASNANRITCVCKDYVVLDTDSGFEILDVNTGIIISPKGPI